MALVDGDYVSLQNRIIATFLADTGAGGLFEDLSDPFPASHGGGTRRSVNTIEAETRGDSSQYSDAELPVIAVVFDDREGESGDDNNPRTFEKRFTFRALCLVRSLDEEEAGVTAGKIAHRLEKVIREQNAAVKIFNIVPTDVDGMDAGAAVTVELTGTGIDREDETTDDKTIGRHAAAVVEFTLGVAVGFTYN